MTVLSRPKTNRDTLSCLYRLSVYLLPAIFSVQAHNRIQDYPAAFDVDMMNLLYGLNDIKSDATFTYHFSHCFPFQALVMQKLLAFLAISPTCSMIFLFGVNKSICISNSSTCSESVASSIQKSLLSVNAQIDNGFLQYTIPLFFQKKRFHIQILCHCNIRCAADCNIDFFFHGGKYGIRLTYRISLFSCRLLKRITVKAYFTPVFHCKRPSRAFRLFIRKPCLDK